MNPSRVVRERVARLTDLPNIGPATRKKLLKTFGSVNGVKTALADAPEDVVAVVGARGPGGQAGRQGGRGGSQHGRVRGVPRASGSAPLGAK